MIGRYASIEQQQTVPQPDSMHGPEPNSPFRSRKVCGLAAFDSPMELYRRAGRIVISLNRGAVADHPGGFARIAGLARHEGITEQPQHAPAAEIDRVGCVAA